MDVKQAVAAARAYFRETFAGEGGESASLEEVWFDEFKNEWNVTFGVQRNLTYSKGLLGTSETVQIRYKTVRVSDADGKVLSVRNREAA